MKVGPNWLSSWLKGLTIILKRREETQRQIYEVIYMKKKSYMKSYMKKSYVARGRNWSDGLTKQELQATSEAKKGWK